MKQDFCMLKPEKHDEEEEGKKTSCIWKTKPNYKSAMKRQGGSEQKEEKGQRLLR